MPKSNIISAKNIQKSFVVGNETIQVLKGITFDVHDGDFVIVSGPSGSGKSTLLHILLGLEQPSSGSVSLLGEDIYSYRTEDDRAVLRKQLIGMVYQQPNWIKSLTVLENVAFPLLLLGWEKIEAQKKASALLEKVGMTEKTSYKPTELSSGQQQRISMARALINNPSIIIADEPTGNLDYVSGQALMQLLHDLNTTENRTIVMVTHDLEYVKYAKSVIQIKDGKVLAVLEGDQKDELVRDSKLKRGVDITND